MTVAYFEGIARGLSAPPAEKVNVRTNPAHEPLIRQLLSAKLKLLDGAWWVYWYWTPEPTGNRPDWGYSGHRLDSKRRAA